MSAIVPLLALLVLTPALRTACDAHRDAVTRLDVNVKIQREDVKRLNDVIRTSRALRKAAGCRMP